MKRRVYIIVAALLLAVAVLAAVLFFYRPELYDDTVNGEFDVLAERYQSIINSGKFSVEYFRQETEFSSLEEYVGAVTDAATARKQAVKIWNKLYGSWHIRGEMPYQVYYDAQSEVWHVCGTLKEGLVGGTAHILIEKEDGRIIAVWHEL